MFDSKLLKEPNFIENKVLRFLYWDIWYRATYPIRNFYHTVVALYQWCVYLYNDRDWDSSYAFDVFAFKLKRLKKGLEEGHAIHEEEEMTSLQEAIDICGRLSKCEYDMKYHALHDAKWGEIESRTEPCEDRDDCVRWITWRSKANTDEEKQQERAEFLAISELETADRNKDIDRLADILKTNSRSWWD